VFVRTSLFLDRTTRNRIGRLVQFAWVLAIVAVIGSRLGLPRSEQLSRFDGWQRVPSHEPCPSYPSSASAAPGLLAISSNIRFLQVIFIESPQLTL
jgi:hypothetical protein